MTTRKRLVGLSDIRHHFFRNEVPIYYPDATCFQLMGMDEWVRRLSFINYNDCFDGAHPNVLVPQRDHAGVFHFETLEQMNMDMLGKPEVEAFIRGRGPGKALFLLYDEALIARCAELDLEVILPAPALQREIDSKVGATRIARRAGVPVVPNALGKVESYEGLRALAAGLGDALVIQTPFGDSGLTTFFVDNADDFARCATAVTAEPEVKVMRRIRPRQAAIEACVTRAGTLVGPLMTEIVGFRELTPHPGGWAGNEVAPGAFSAAQSRAAHDHTVKLGDELARLGYRGYFEVDYLIDRDSGELYLGEINPRITGATSMTNLAAFAHADAPLFLFHLLEYDDVDFELDTAALNRRWADPANIDCWSQLVLKRVEPERMIAAAAPRTGVWRMREDGTVEHVRMQTHRRTVEGIDEAFWLRTAAPGDVVDGGDDIGVLVLRERLTTDDGALTDRALRWQHAIRAHFAWRSLP